MWSERRLADSINTLIAEKSSTFVTTKCRVKQNRKKTGIAIGANGLIGAQHPLHRSLPILLHILSTNILERRRVDSDL